MNEIRDGFTNFIGLCNLKAIKLAQSDSDVKKNYTEKFFYGYGKIKTYIKPFYKIDKELLISLENLYDCVLSIITDEKTDKSINDLREDFADKYLKYDWSYWKYIQRRKEGNYMNSDDAFDNVYYQFLDEIDKNSL